MSLTDFLFNGTPPPSVTTYGSTTASLPPWFEAYQQALLGRSNSIAGEPYQAFTAPSSSAYDALAAARQAPFTADTTAGWQMGRDAATAGQPAVNAGLAATNTALGQSASSVVDPILNQSMNNPTATQAASGYLTAGTQGWPQAAASYMNPYTDLAANRAVDLSNRNLNETVLPGINDNFVKSGMFGSSRQGDFTNRAVRDQQDSLNGTLGNLYSTQYNNAAAQYGSDASRNLTAGATAGNLQSTDTQNLQQAGNLYGNFANADRTTTGTLGQDMGNLGSTNQRLGLTGASILGGIGSQQQGQQQSLLDTMYGNFTEQRDYPKTQATFLNNQIRGLQSPTSTTSTNTAPTNNYSASPFAQILGASTGLSGLLGQHARGGRIRGYKRGGRVIATRAGYLSEAA